MRQIEDKEKAGIYHFLKVVFATAPSKELLKYLQTPQVLESLNASGVFVDKKELVLSQLEKLQTDYTQLFISPGKHIALNEAVYTEETSRFWGDVTVEIKKLIDAFGLELDENWTRMPDHISVEFELMQKLWEAKIRASETNDEKVVEQCTAAIGNLFEGHILRWVPRVCAQVIERSQTSCYKAVGTWTKMFIQLEATNLTKGGVPCI